MQKNNILIHKNLITLLFILFGGLFYFIVILVTYKYIASAIVDIIHFAESLKFGYSLDKVLSIDIVLIYSLLFVALILTWMNIFKSLSKTIKSIQGTREINKTISAKFSDSLKIYVIDSNEIIAFTSGLLKTKIYLSKGLIKSLTKKELQAVIAHEKFHALKYDPLLMLFIRLIHDTTPMKFIQKNFINNYSMITELSADFYAINYVKNERYLIQALNKLITSRDFGKNFLFSSFNDKLERIPILVGLKQLTIKYNYLIVFFSIAILSLLITPIISFNITKGCENINNCVYNVLSTDLSQSKTTDSISCSGQN